MRARLAVLAVAGLIAVLGVTAITASGTGHETEVRITAQRLADGRTRLLRRCMLAGNQEQ